MERIAEIMQKFPACCPRDTFGVLTRAPEKRSVAYGGLITMETLIFSGPLRRRRGWGAASGVCLIPPDLPLFYGGYSLGLAQNQTGWSIIVMNCVGSACLQLGHLAGTVPSFLMIAAKQSRRERPQPVRPLLYRRSV
jgi:hypothetical protein